MIWKSNQKIQHLHTFTLNLEKIHKYIYQETEKISEHTTAASSSPNKFQKFEGRGKQDQSKEKTLARHDTSGKTAERKLLNGRVNLRIRFTFF